MHRRPDRRCGRASRAWTEAAKSEHLKILSRISRLLNRDAFRERLLQARDAEEVLALLEEGELQLATR